MKISDYGELMCPYKCVYSDDGICCGGLMQCSHLQERARICLKEEREFFKQQQRYVSDDDEEWQMYLQDIKRLICKYERILEAKKINVMVKPAEQGCYKEEIDACVQRKRHIGNIIVEYANGIGRTKQNLGAMVLVNSELYAEEIYYYEMKYIMDCAEIPSHKYILQNQNSKIGFYYNPYAQKEGKAFNFSYDGKNIYGTIVFYKCIETDDTKQTVSLNQNDIIYIENFLDRILYTKEDKLTIEARNKFYTKVVGVTQEKNRQLYASKCCVGQQLELVRERTNPYDSNAIAVYDGNHQLGYIKKKIAAQLAEKIDRGSRYICYVENVTGGGDMFWGINIKIIEC